MNPCQLNCQLQVFARIAVISKKEREREESPIIKNRIDLSLGSIPIVVDSRPNDISTCPEQSSAELGYNHPVFQ